MTTHPEPHHNDGSPPVAKWVLVGFLAIAAFFLIVEHQAHVLGALPFLLLLACPLMHLFMHRDHGGHDHNDDKDERK